MSDQEIMGRKGYRFTVFLADKRIDRKDAVRFVTREPLFAKKESQAKEIISTEGGYYVPFKIDSDGYTVWDVSKYVKFTGDEAKDAAKLRSLFLSGLGNKGDSRGHLFKFLHYGLQSDQVIESNGVQYTGSDAQGFIKSGGYKPNGSLTDTYPFFVVVDDVVVSGWDYKEDAKEHASEIKEDLGFSSKVYTKKTVKSRGFEEADLEVVRERRRTAAKGYEPNHGFEEEKMEYVFHTKSDASRFRGALDRSGIRLQGKPSTRKTKPEFRHGGSPGYSVHFKGLGLEDTYEAVGLAKSMGGREYGLNFGTPEYREWASSKGPYEPNHGFGAADRAQPDWYSWKIDTEHDELLSFQGPTNMEDATERSYDERTLGNRRAAKQGRVDQDEYYAGHIDTISAYRVFELDLAPGFGKADEEALRRVLEIKGYTENGDDYKPNFGDSHLDDLIDHFKLTPFIKDLRDSDPRSMEMLRDSYKRLRELTTLNQNDTYALNKFVNLVNAYDPERGITAMDGNAIYKIHDSLGLGKFAANSPGIDAKWEAWAKKLKKGSVVEFGGHKATLTTSPAPKSAPPDKRKANLHIQGEKGSFPMWVGRMGPHSSKGGYVPNPLPEEKLDRIRREEARSFARVAGASRGWVEAAGRSAEPPWPVRDFYRQSGLSKSDTDMLRHLAENRRHNIPVLSGGREEFESWERKAIGSLLKKKYLSRYEITIGGDDGWGVSLTAKGHKKAQSLDELWDNIIS